MKPFGDVKTRNPISNNNNISSDNNNISSDKNNISSNNNNISSDKNNNNNNISSGLTKLNYDDEKEKGTQGDPEKKYVVQNTPKSDGTGYKQFSAQDVKPIDSTVERPLNDLNALDNTDLNSLNNIDDYICLIVSHNYRIQCFADKLLSGKTNERKIRFKNTAILRLTIDLEQGTFVLELVHDGELSDKEESEISAARPYYTSIKNNNDGLVYFGQIDGNINKLNLLPDDLTKLKQKVKANKLVFYIVRHGQAEHNEPGYNLQAKLHLKLDTSVTTPGQMQALNAAENLARILDGQKIHEVFVSDLQRTWQTAGPFFAKHLISTATIIVDPCASEIDTKGDGRGNCDTKSANKYDVQKLGRENYPACTPNACKTRDLGNQTINIDWALYSAFYQNKMRGYSNLKDIPNCKSTNMIAMAVYYLLHKEEIANDSNLNQLYSRDENDNDSENENDSEGTIEIGGGKTKKRKYNQRTKRNNKKRTKRNI